MDVSTAALLAVHWAGPKAAWWADLMVLLKAVKKALNWAVLLVVYLVELMVEELVAMKVV